jgi:hypothetical protein
MHRAATTVLRVTRSSSSLMFGMKLPIEHNAKLIRKKTRLVEQARTKAVYRPTTHRCGSGARDSNGGPRTYGLGAPIPITKFAKTRLVPPALSNISDAEFVGPFGYPQHRASTRLWPFESVGS